MAQYEMNLRDYWFIVRRRRVTIALCTIVAAAFSFWFAQQKVPIYQTSASVKYEPSAAVSGLLVEVLSRSEEHTSELQSLTNIVCRLLLEIGRASCRERV